MHSKLCIAWILALVSAGCFSPTYHDGNLKCTASGQCPKVVSIAPWTIPAGTMGRIRRRGRELHDTGADGAPKTPLAMVEARTRQRWHHPISPSDTEIVIHDVPVLTDVVSPKDVLVGPDPSTADTVDVPIVGVSDALPGDVPPADAPSTDMPMQVDSPDTGNADGQQGWSAARRTGGPVRSRRVRQELRLLHAGGPQGQDAGHLRAERRELVPERGPSHR